MNCTKKKLKMGLLVFCFIFLFVSKLKTTEHTFNPLKIKDYFKLFKQKKNADVFYTYLNYLNIP